MKSSKSKTLTDQKNKIVGILLYRPMSCQASGVACRNSEVNTNGFDGVGLICI